MKRRHGFSSCGVKRNASKQSKVVRDWRSEGIIPSLIF